MTVQTRIIPITDDRGRFLVPEDDLFEPEPSSVVLTQGLTGTAWQLSFRDGLWHRLGSTARVTWESLLRERGLILVYDAQERKVKS